MEKRSLEEGVQVGDFRIEKRLGAGGMGIVYQARQVSLNRVVALKVLGSALTRPDHIGRFQREAQAAAKLQHPSIAAIYYVGQDEDVCYMALEYIDGLSLRKVIERLARMATPASSIDAVVGEDAASADRPKLIRFDEPTTPAEVTPETVDPSGQFPSPTPQAQALIGTKPYIRRCCEIIRDAALALEHAHQKGVVHRDIKPENLMLDRDGRVHIIDFGIARFFEDMTLTQTGQLVGTPMYMSPEQVTGRIEVDHRTDIYSLGLVLYELLTLRPAILAPTRDAVLRNIVTKSLPPVSWQNRAIPKPLEGIAHQAISRDPDERYQSASEFGLDLANFLAGCPTMASPYRYKFDKSEIAAQRPLAVITVAFLFYASAFLLVVLASFVLTFTSLWEAGIAVILIPSLALVVAIGLVAVGYGIFSGRLAAVFVGGLLAVLLLWWSGLELLKWFHPLLAFKWGAFKWGGSNNVSAYLLSIACAATATILGLCRKKTMAWFLFARRLRAEYKSHRISSP